MGQDLISVHEDELQARQFPDRWSKDLVNHNLGARGGFSLGVALYTSDTFGQLQVHEDQEAVYIISGVGEMRIGTALILVRPGSAALIPVGAPHATRRTGDEPVKLVYCHGKP